MLGSVVYTEVLFHSNTYFFEHFYIKRSTEEVPIDYFGITTRSEQAPNYKV